MPELNLEELDENTRAYIDDLQSQHTSELDKVRNKNGKEAISKAESRLMNNSKFMDKVRSDLRAEIEEEARLSGEEKLQLRQKELDEQANAIAYDKNRLVAQKGLLDAKIEPSDKLLDMLTNADSEKTMSNITTYVETFTDTLATTVDGIKKDLLEGSNVPNVGGDGATANFQEQYTKARNEGRTLDAIRIQREASEAGETLI